MWFRNNNWIKKISNSNDLENKVVNLKSLRQEANLTQEKLAELIDISTRQLQRIESGNSDASLLTLRILIDVLKISDEDIVRYIKN